MDGQGSISGCCSDSLSSLVMRNVDSVISVSLLFESTFGHGSLLLVPFLLLTMTFTSYILLSKRRWILPFQNQPVLNSGHVWCLNEELIGLELFDSDVSTELKRAMVTELNENEGMDKPPRSIEHTITKLWENYREAIRTHEHLNVFNDDAGTCVVVIEEYMILLRFWKLHASKAMASNIQWSPQTVISLVYVQLDLSLMWNGLTGRSALRGSYH